MANKDLFSTRKAKGAKNARKSPIRVPTTNAVNEAGGKAYGFSDKHALAQYVATGCLGSTYYASEGEQLEKIISLSQNVSLSFMAKCATYARKKGHMKDTPALLLALIASRSNCPQDREIFEAAFKRVIDNGRMLRNFVQMIRSGRLGRSSFGSMPKRLINRWLTDSDDIQIVRASVGNDPSLVDIIKMTHPRAGSKAREALFGHLIGKEVSLSRLPQVLRDFEAFKQGKTDEVPNVPWEMLTAQELDTNQWKAIGRKMGWQALRMNLQTLQRHDAFKDSKMVDFVAKKLADADEIKKARVLPYQLLMAYTASVDVPDKIHKALEDALEIATENIPEFEGTVAVCPDHSGSMHSPVSGYRGSATTRVNCVDVAALICACVMRRNPDAKVYPFADSVSKTRLNPRDTVMTNAKKLASLPAGGTNCSAPLVLMNKEGFAPDLTIFVSDCESWRDFTSARGTAGMSEFAKIQKKNGKAKLVAIDLQPNATTQWKDSKDVLNIGGFSDSVFEIIDNFGRGYDKDHWVQVIEKTELTEGSRD